jgi:REP element-mobilizing transposase RayT
MAKNPQACLWDESYIFHLLVSTVGHISETTVIKYIEEQKIHGC